MGASPSPSAVRAALVKRRRSGRYLVAAREATWSPMVFRRRAQAACNGSSAPRRIPAAGPPPRPPRHRPRFFPETQRVSVRAQTGVLGDRSADGQKPCRSAAAHGSQQRRVAAEQMCAAGDVEIKPHAADRRHHRCKRSHQSGCLPASDDRRPHRHRTPSVPGQMAGGVWRAAGRYRGRSGAARVVDGIDQQAFCLFRDDDAWHHCLPCRCGPLPPAGGLERGKPRAPAFVVPSLQTLPRKGEKPIQRVCFNINCEATFLRAAA